MILSNELFKEFEQQLVLTLTKQEGRHFSCRSIVQLATTKKREWYRLRAIQEEQFYMTVPNLRRGYSTGLTRFPSARPLDQQFGTS